MVKGTKKAGVGASRELELLEESAKAKPNDPQVQASLSYLYAQKKMRNQSLARAQTALALAPEDPVVLSDLGGAHEALGDRPEAIQFVQKGIQKGYTLDDLQRDPDMQALLKDPSFKVRAKK